MIDDASRPEKKPLNTPKDETTGQFVSPLPLIAREVRHAEVSRLLAMNFSQAQIAKQLDMPLQTCKDIIRAIRADWLEKTTTQFENYLAEEIATIDCVASEAWQAWLRSIEWNDAEYQKKWKVGAPNGQRHNAGRPGRRKVGKPTKRPQLVQPELANGKASDEDGHEVVIERDSKVPPGSAEVLHILKERKGVGDPRWLELILQCSERRTRLLGMDAPARLLRDTGHADATDANRVALSAAAGRLIEFRNQLVHRRRMLESGAPVDGAARATDDSGADDVSQAVQEDGG